MTEVIRINSDGSDRKMAYYSRMSNLTGIDFQSIGVCVKSPDGVVQTQNHKCMEVCGDQLGKKCAFGCGLFISEKMAAWGIDKGFNTFRCTMNHGLRINVALINDGVHLTSLIYDVTETVRDQMAAAEKFRLSNAETKVLELYLHGYTNAEIAAKLFVCRTTLRTHLNNIYKKIPANLKARIVSSHLRLASAEARP